MVGKYNCIITTAPYTPRTSQLILQVLQSGGSENIAMARMMLDDIGLSLPPMPVELDGNDKFLNTGYCLQYVGRSLHMEEIWVGMAVRIIQESNQDTQQNSGLEDLHGYVGQVVKIDLVKEIAFVEFQDNEKNIISDGGLDHRNWLLYV